MANIGESRATRFNVPDLCKQGKENIFFTASVVYRIKQVHAMSSDGHSLIDVTGHFVKLLTHRMARLKIP